MTSETGDGLLVKVNSQMHAPPSALKSKNSNISNEFAFEIFALIQSLQLCFKPISKIWIYFCKIKRNRLMFNLISIQKIENLKNEIFLFSTFLLQNVENIFF